MSEIIGSVYEVVEKLGAGGGGVVFLANHTRLKKRVVLKADKRKLSTRPELLRREVDVLKDLSHPYIPQVYDFFTENETVYTAMDFVDGESLDKPLKAGKRFPQPQVIRWAKQLLQALDYLHSPTHGDPPRGYVHSDIKPANLMCRLNGDICLIDFNISLAVGEMNVIGASEGYASPEHYGLDFSSSDNTATQTEMDKTVLEVDKTVLEGVGTVPMTVTGNQSIISHKMIVPDIRSDIYSTGATLYHLFSGRRPAKDAQQVVPLSEREVSGQVAAIIAKAMNPNPDLRYQTAAEMLWDFEHLHENDPRTKRLKTQRRIVAAMLTALFLVGGISTFTGQRQIQHEAEVRQHEAEIRRQAAEKRGEIERLTNTALEAVYSSESAYQSGDTPSAVRYARDALDTLDMLPVLEEDARQLEVQIGIEVPPAAPASYRSQAQKALTDALGVYELSDGYKLYSLIKLSSEPLKIVLSPGGTRTAAMTLGEALVFDTESGRQLASLAAEPSALANLVFLNEDVLLYAGEGGLRAYDVTQERELWQGRTATGIALSADSSTVAAVYRDESQAIVYDAASGAVLQTISFGIRRMPVAANDIYIDPEDGLFALDRTGRHLAVSFSDGSLWCYDVEDPEGDASFSLYTDGSDFTHFEGGFCGDYLAFSADGDRSVFAVIDVPNLQQVGGFAMTSRFHVQADESGIFFSVEDIMVELDTVTWEQRELGYTGKDIRTFTTTGNYTAAASDGALYLFGGSAQLVDAFERLQPRRVCLAGDYAILAREDQAQVQVLKLENHPEAQLFSYDPIYPHSEARISADGKTVMLFSRYGFRLYSMDGGVLAEVEIPDAGEVYDCQYRRDADGSRLEIIYNSGLVRTYSARDGSLLFETQGEVPSGDAYDEYLLDRLRITSPLHGAPAAYDRESGELVKELSSEDYMTYATQVGEYVIVEFINTDGERYGLLLDGNCETLAYLPNLCDILGEDTLVFDDMAGNLRQCRIYSIQELTALAEQI